MKSNSYLRRNGSRLALASVLLLLVCFGFMDPHLAAAGALMLTFETVAGSTIACSVAAPASFDGTGYAALTYTGIGEITDLGQGLGRKYNVVTHAPIATSQKVNKKGSYELPQIDLVMAWDQNDAGQDLLRAAALTNSSLSFKIVKQSGDIRYFTAQVSEFTENFGTVDNVVQGKMHLLFQTEVVDNPL
jgi:hypothetical protein